MNNLLAGMLATLITIPMTVTAPCTNIDGTVLHDLKEIRVYSVRCASADTILIAIVPAAGAECDSLNFDVQVLDGTTYDFFAVAIDSFLNESPRAVHYGIAVQGSVAE